MTLCVQRSNGDSDQAQVGGVQLEGVAGLGGVDGVRGRWVGCPVAPVFSDFRGKRYESEFPRVLVEYYRSCGVSSGRRCWCNRGWFDGSGVVESDGDAGRGSRVGVEAFGQGAGVSVGGSSAGGADGPFCSVAGSCGDGASNRADGDGSVGDGACATFTTPGCFSGGSSGGIAGGVGDSGVAGVGKKTLENREKRRRHKERKRRRQVSQGRVVEDERGERVGSLGGCASELSGVESSVPEWRRGNGGVVHSKFERFERRKKCGYFSESSYEERKVLRETRAEMLAAQNELNAFRAKRQLELEKAKDVGQLKKRQETYIMRQTEVNKVQVEKAFASLARAGNVPGVVGSAETVVSSSASGKSVPAVFSGAGSGSVSPNSSVSLAEIHAIQRDSLSKQKDIDEMRRQLDHVKFIDPEVYRKSGGDFKRAPTVETGYTVDSEGQPIGEPPDSHWGGEVRADGKYHYITDEPFHLYEY